MKKKIKTIFFDIGDTLIDMSISQKALCFGLKNVLSNKVVTDELALKWENESHITFEHYYKKREFHTVKRLQVISLKNVLLKYDVDLIDYKLINIVNAVWRYFIKNCRLYEDVMPTLSQLVQDGYKLGLITNGDAENVNSILKQHNLENIFKTKVISSEFRSYKPLLFQRALELIQCLPQETIYVDDLVTDIYGAKELGMVTVLINRNKTTQDKMAKIEPDFRIDDLQKISTVIDKTEI